MVNEEENNKILKNISDFLQNNDSFDFENAIKTIFMKEVIESNLKGIYNNGKSTAETKNKAVYALYENNELKKIGKAADKNYGLFHRMSQYYRIKDGKCLKISELNRDKIIVKYAILESKEDCWVIERLLQSLAYYFNEAMPWEEKSRKGKTNG